MVMRGARAYVPHTHTRRSHWSMSGDVQLVALAVRPTDGYRALWASVRIQSAFYYLYYL